MSYGKEKERKNLGVPSNSMKKTAARGGGASTSQKILWGRFLIRGGKLKGDEVASIKQTLGANPRPRGGKIADKGSPEVQESKKNREGCLEREPKSGKKGKTLRTGYG